MGQYWSPDDSRWLQAMSILVGIVIACFGLPLVYLGGWASNRTFGFRVFLVSIGLILLMLAWSIASGWMATLHKPAETPTNPLVVILGMALFGLFLLPMYFTLFGPIDFPTRLERLAPLAGFTFLGLVGELALFAELYRWKRQNMGKGNSNTDRPSPIL